MKRFLLPAVLAAALAPSLHADVKLPAVLNSHMVLQREVPLPIWGTADPGEEVTVALGDDKAAAKADDKGRWKVMLPARKASAVGVSLTVSGKSKIELTDILIGDVWVGSGQSNMEWPMAASMNAKESIAVANHPAIRLFQVPKVQAPKPAADVKATWTACTPMSVSQFSAVLYFFGSELQKELNIPFGLINSSWGGSPIEPWTIKGEQSGGMYNGMIAPLLPFPIKGVIWYQGESNVGNGLKYRDKKEDLIAGWRKVWGTNLPFYFVQLAPWKPKQGGYAEGMLPQLWEAQVATLKIPGTGMAVTTDLVDDITDIHPKNKHDVGKRLALWALAKDYGKKDVVYSGPLFKGIKVENGKIRVSFAHTAGELKSRDGKPISEFEIAGDDGNFVAAEATVDGETVVVSAKDVAKPAHVRFGWRTIANPNLVNKAGLPASPFQSNNWTGGTGE